MQLHSPKRIARAIGAFFLLLAISPTQAADMTNADVIKMLQFGLREDVVIAAIGTSKTHFDLSPDALASLQKAKVSAKVIGAMTAASSSTEKMTAPKPAAMAAQQATPDEPPVALAKKVLGGGSEAIQSLRTAMQLSGFNVRNLDGSFVVKQPANPQPIGFQSWEVSALAEPGSALLVPMSTLTSVLTQVIPPLKNIDLSGALVDGIRNSATSEDPRLKFWAQFIMALGQIPRNGYDLKNTTDPAKTYFDKVQTAFILHRLAGEIGNLAAAAGSIAAPKPAAIAPWRTHFEITDAVFRPITFPEIVRVAESSGGGAPCSLDNEAAEQVVDLSTSLGAMGFDKLTEYLKEHIDELETVSGTTGLDKYSSVVGKLGVIMEYVKLLAIYAKGLHVEFHMDKSGPPLVRTHLNTENGEQRAITASVSLKKLPEMDWLNCIRVPLGMMGLEIPSPFKVGPMTDAGVEWAILEGNSIVKFKDEVSGHPNPTDKNGETSIDVEGQKQSHRIPDWALPVKKQATVEARVQITRPQMRGDLLEALGNMPTPGSILSILKVPAGMIARSTLLAPKSYTFEVTDWRVNLELSFDSQITIKGDEGGIHMEVSWHEQSTVPITLDYDSKASPASDSMLWGEAALVEVERKLETGFDKCSFSVADVSNTLQVFGPPGIQRLLAEDPVHINLLLKIPQPWGSGTLTCIPPKGPPHPAPWAAFFPPNFLTLHADEVKYGAIQVTDWTPVNPNFSPGLGDIVAERTYDRLRDINDLARQFNAKPIRNSKITFYEKTVMQLRLPSQSQKE